MKGKNEDNRDWLKQSKTDNPRLFSELDILLRGLDRFFNIEYLPSSNEDIASKNFLDELLTIRDAILRLLGILELIIPENRKNAYWFQKFTETKYLSEKKINTFRQELYTQDTPEKSLYLLYDSFVNMKGIITELSRCGHIPYLSFINAGNMISKEIRENSFFNPFRKHMNPEYDVITNHAISNIVRAISNKEEKKHISIIYLYLFRFIRIVNFIDISSQRQISLSTSLVLLVLLRSEINSFKTYIDKVAKKIKNQDLEMLIHAIAYQFSMETKRVYQQELKDILRRRASVQFRGKIENSHGILKNLTEQSIVQLTQFYDHTITGEEIFSSFMTKLQQSIRLREDIYVLHAIVSLFCANSEDHEARLKYFESLKNYMVYFESFTFRLLRYDDYEEFYVFFHNLNSVKRDDLFGKSFGKIQEKTKHFKIFLETTLRQINNRAEIADKPLDTERIESMLAQYL